MMWHYVNEVIYIVEFTVTTGAAANPHALKLCRNAAGV